MGTTHCSHQLHHLASNLLSVLGLLVDLERVHAKLLEKICAGPSISASELSTTDALTIPAKTKVKVGKIQGSDLFGNEH